MRKVLLVVLLCGLVAAVAPSLWADSFGQAFTGAAIGQQLGNGPFTLGWSFDVTSTITVTNLAVFHNNGVGLLESHQVGIWNSSGGLMVMGTVNPGGPCGLDQLGAQEWCTVGVNVKLTPGMYTIGAIWNSLLDPMIFPGTLSSQGISNVNGAGIAFLQNEFIAGGILTDPTNTTGDTMSYFGPNFTYTTTTGIPEPASLFLLGTGLLGLGRLVGKKR